MDDPLQMNDWSFRKLAICVVSALLLFILLLFLEFHGLVFPAIRPLLGLFILLVLPGMLLLRSLRAHALGSVKTLFYAVAISAALAMLLGFVLNLLLGPAEMLTQTAMIAGTIMMVLGLMATAWLRDRDYGRPDRLATGRFLDPKVLVLIFLPLLAVISAYVLNATGNNILQFVLIGVIAALTGLLFISKRSPPYVFPFAIASMALAMVLHSSLVSEHLVEWADVSFEMWSAQRVLTNGFWTPSIPELTNSVLSITMLAPMLSSLTGLNMEWVFKLAYPLLFPMLPLGVFLLFRHKVGERTAFGAAFLILASSIFFTEMLGLNRQMVAELFFLAMLVIVNGQDFSPRAQAGLLVLLGVAMATSHYGLVLVLGAIALVALVLYLIIRPKTGRGRYSMKAAGGLVAVMAAIAFVWYFFVLDSAIGQIIQELVQRVLEGQSASGQNNYLMMPFTHIGAWSVADLALAIGYYLFFMLIIIGLVCVIVRRRDQRFGYGYLSLAIVAVAALVAAALSPNVYTLISEGRLFHVSLLLLAPLPVLGLMVLFHRPWNGFGQPRAARVAVAALLVGFLFVNSGVAGAIGGSVQAFELYPDEVDRAHFNAYEHTASKFMASAVGHERMVTANADMAYLMQMQLGFYFPFKGTSTLIRDDYVWTHYFMSETEMLGQVVVEDPSVYRTNKHIIDLSADDRAFYYGMSKVYASPGAAVLFNDDVMPRPPLAP